MDIRAEVLRSCQALFMPAQVTELRVLGIKGQRGFTFNAAGWFNDWQALAHAAENYSKRGAEGVYVVINALHRACLARTDNTIVERLKDTSSDKDVTARNWLPIDIDPVRPSGVASSDIELFAARDLAIEITRALETEFGFPAGLRAHSGNGIHLLYRIDLPNDDASRELVKAALEGLAERFSTPAVKVDRGMHNASRIWKLWGTIARKGQHMPDRPHRQSKLLSKWTFGELTVAPTAALERLAALKPAAATAAASTSSPAGRVSHGAPAIHFFNLDAWIERNAIAISRTETFDGTGTRYILEHCLFDSSHVRSSAILGRAPSGAIFYKCQHESCATKGWKDAKALFPNERRARSSAKTTSVAGTQNRRGNGVAQPATESDEDASPYELAAEFIDHTYAADELGRCTLRRHRETFYAYDPTAHIYRGMTSDRVKVEITRWLGENGHKTTARAMLDVLNSVNSLVTVPESYEMPFRTHIDPETRCAQADAQPRNWITLQNGILDLDKIMAGEPIADCLMNHTSEWLSTTALPFAFPTNSLEASCPMFLDFLDEVLEHDSQRIAMIQEMFGYCFWRSSSLEKFFILQGRGNNGKSTILRILIQLLDKQNVSSLTLQQIADPVLAIDLYQKVANVCGDLPESELLDEGLIKKITSGESITVRRLYKGPMSFIPFAKLIFATNPLPRFNDNTLGIWRRMVLVPFEYVVPAEQIDDQLESRLAAELPGILCWALQGAARLAETRRFSRCEKAEEANRDYRRSCFPVLTFLDECTAEGGSVHSRELWDTYKRWCKDCGLTKPKSLHTFIKDAIGFLPGVSYPRVRTGMAGEITLTGIQLRPNLNLGMDSRTTDAPYYVGGD